MLARPYWVAQERQSIGLWGVQFSVKEAWIARSTLALIIFLSVFLVYLSKLINDWNARFYNALQDGNSSALA